tara:strand:- start:311 stop:1885 length:1575 start_codon:yes stop_codon:yes gene_type:complete
MEKRFNALKKAVREHIELGALLKKESPFGGFTINVTAGEWRGRYDPDRIPEFMDWLEKQNNDFILSKGGKGIQMFPSQTTPIFPGQASFDAKTQTTTRVLGGVEGRWTDVHIRSAYQKSVQQTRANLRKQGVKNLPGFESTQEGLAGVFNAPFHADRVQLAYTSTFSNFQGITKAMEAPIAQTIALGMAEGRNPKELAKAIAGIRGTIDKVGLQRARTLARTEVIRAHHGANIAEMRAMGIEEVIVKAEWLTAGDNRVCPRCEGMEGQVFKLDEIEPLIPLHPNCRCVAIPIVPRGKRGQVVKRETLTPEDTWLPTKDHFALKDQLNDKLNISSLSYGRESFFTAFKTNKNKVNYIADDLLRMKTQNKKLGKMMDNMLPISLDITDVKSFPGKLENSLAIGSYSSRFKEITIAAKGKFRKPVLRFNDFTVTGNDLAAMTRHEYGHHVYLSREGIERVGRDTWREFYKSKPQSWWKRHTSEYGKGTPGEAFAESFSAYTSPLHNTGGASKTLPDEILELFTKWFR